MKNKYTGKTTDSFEAADKFSKEFYFSGTMESVHKCQRGKIPLSFKLEPREIGWSGMDWIDLVRDKDQ
jgi:hypothetical protein